MDRETPTIQDVARIAAVSTATVSRVLNRSARVSESTQERVRRAVTILEYEPDQAAKQLSMRKRKMREGIAGENPTLVKEA